MLYPYPYSYFNEFWTPAFSGVTDVGLFAGPSFTLLREIELLLFMCFMENGEDRMNVVYNDKTDLLYIRFDDKKQDVINRRVSEDIVLDIGENDKIVGIEIIDASRQIRLEKVLPIKYEVQKEKSLRG